MTLYSAVLLVLVGNIGSWFQFKISFENQTCPTGFP